jgi:DNA-binding response OmpR family regulator
MSERPPRILLADDEQAIQTLLSYPLQKDGYEVVRASDGRDALARFGEQTFDLVVLDVMMPSVDGLEVCRRLRARSTVPIIMLTAKAEEIDKVLGPRARGGRLHHQALLHARVPLAREGRAAAGGHAARRRPGRRRGPPRGPRAAHRSRQAGRGGPRRPVTLTFVEFEILHAPGRRARARVHPGHAPHADLGDSAYRDPRTIDVHIRHLREKIEQDAKDPEYLFTVRGVGYRFRDTGD